MRWQRRGAEAALLLLVAACATPQRPPAPSGPVKIGKPYQVFGKTYTPADDRSYDERGIASWYGPGFHALVTANGETYNQDDLTAAHKTLPMPSWVEVENLDNGRKLTVRINDRGPFVEGRIIDLSRRSAQLLGVDKVGLAKVRVRRVYPGQNVPISVPNTPKPVPNLPISDPNVTEFDLPASVSAPFFVQVAALSDPGRIAWLKGFLGAYGPVVTEAAPAGLTRIRLGPYASTAAADAALAQVRAAGYAEARIVKPSPK
jgi:rare lipoprotein A